MVFELNELYNLSRYKPNTMLYHYLSIINLLSIINVLSIIF